VISDISSFLRYFEGVHRRTVRDVGSLPRAAERWKPPASEEAEASWGVPEVVRHIAEARPFFVSAFLDPGWVWEPWPQPLEGSETWIPALERSWNDLVEALGDVPETALRNRLPMLDEPDRTISAWRVLMMLCEHEVHHRSQIATYAGLNGWPVHQIFGRMNEWVVAQREAQLQRRIGHR
jgi:uncharacterized damage-inducible protein DinB